MRLVIGVVLLGAALAGCSGGGSEADEATSYAMASCGIAETNFPGDYSYNFGPSIDFSATDPISTVLRVSSNAKKSAVNAENAAAMNSEWSSLASATAEMSAFTDRLVRWREYNPANDPAQLRADWPSFEQDASAFNAALDRADTICRALRLRLASEG